MKKLTVLAFIILFPVLAFGQLKMGIMDPQTVLDALPETEQLERELQSYIQEREQAFQRRYMAWIEEVTEYSEQVEAGLFTDAERREIEERLGEGESELTALQNRIQNQIRQRQNELFSPLMARVDRALDAVSSEMGLDYVINQRSNTGDPFVYYASERAPNITDRIIEYLLEN